MSAPSPPLQALFATRPLDPVADGLPIPGAGLLLMLMLVLVLVLEGEKWARRRLAGKG
ncbi:hypothetical protein [Sabulicella glaciei]|uniref:Uncharacterized protein n=1 Tax=Sabulicella glaciei TaxID=2984948 RepID=A0ABT3NWZ2_9PROT|nr:hypothetical protein [Roseococcus sp. MDT2-1-1]MCW8086641.1 hypothetical protein [Roseococcus sp. MDT2-1-1]